ncbi:unnamed protein product [Microthlaspi erraticum]|uniref:GAG-pre-integrase domain-containing protein n=1 Tax=Microthlaspi erraticum TaxID=1685480 RepID=A0A6D2IYV7_9BRAS|nr:unnamed protein product [Microthlaspi erraticum]
MSATRGKIAESIMSANRMYVLIAETCRNEEDEKCLQVDVSDKTELWHHRYGHLSYNGLTTLHNKEMVVGLPDIQPVKATCEACVKGKQHRVAFPKQTKREQLRSFNSFILTCVVQLLHRQTARRDILSVSSMISLGKPGSILP